MDNALGQKWLRGARGAFRPFPAFRLGTESGVLDKPQSLYTKQMIYPPGNPPNFENPCNPPVAPRSFGISDLTVLVGNTFSLTGPMNFIGGDEQIPTTPVSASIASAFTFTDHLFITCGSIVGDSYPHYGADVWRDLPIIADLREILEQKRNG